MVLDGIISTIVGDHSDIAPTQAIGVVHSPNSVNPKTYCHGNTEPSMSRWLKACVENLQGASQADEDKFRPLWKHSESHRNDAVTQKMRSNICDNWFCPHGWLHCQHEHFRHDRDGHSRPGLHPHSLSYSHTLW